MFAYYCSGQGYPQKYGVRTAFGLTGIINLECNTLYQLHDMVWMNDPQLENMDKLVLIADLFDYMLCGRVTNEYLYGEHNCVEPGDFETLLSTLEARHDCKLRDKDHRMKAYLQYFGPRH